MNQNEVGTFDWRGYIGYIIEVALMWAPRALLGALLLAAGASSTFFGVTHHVTMYVLAGAVLIAAAPLPVWRVALGLTRFMWAVITKEIPRRRDREMEDPVFALLRIYSGGEFSEVRLSSNRSEVRKDNEWQRTFRMPSPVQRLIIARIEKLASFEGNQNDTTEREIAVTSRKGETIRAVVRRVAAPGGEDQLVLRFVDPSPKAARVLT